MNEDVRFDDATRPQVAAADPRSASWVSANAGSGKTRVLTDRVARLLLAGTPPQRILCLTFTIAAAANMQVRLFERLGEWSMLPDAELKLRLLRLGESEERLKKCALEDVRTLFARALETPGGLKIQTVHAFSSALLKRFPLEAGVSPRFKQIDDREARRLQTGILDELAAGSPEIYDPIAREVSEAGISGFLDEIAARREGFESPAACGRVLRQFGLDSLADADQELLGLAGSLLTVDDREELRSLADALAGGGKPERSGKSAGDIIEILRGGNAGTTLRALARCFLTGVSANEPFTANARWPRKDVVNQLDHRTQDWLAGYRRRIERAWAEAVNIRAAEKSLALHEFAAAFLERYEQKKRAGALLDFNDLILKSLRLLQDRECAQWVLYRLDGGIDHVLIDEAQDVSPAQWGIISEIAREFTAGLGARDGQRTVFAVGDEKQSIYGFQGAAPEKFDMMRRHFRKRYEAAGLNFTENDLRHSFRSSPAILDLVDAVFSGCRVPGFGTAVMHRAFKEDLPGRVDIWPFIRGAPASGGGTWHETSPAGAEPESHVKLARAITVRVRNMLDGGELLPDGEGGGRPIRPGDIMILVRRRSDLFYAVIQELKAGGLPVAGADRLKLIEELAVRDLTAMLSFLAYNRDDLSLAAVLRSPLFGLTESQLFELAHDRGRLSLWESLRRSGGFADTVIVIEDLMDSAARSSPYETLERMLTRHGGRERLTARLGREIEETVDSFLQQALTYEEEESASLTGFLNWLTADTEIKRQLDQGVDEIRVMTIHGAKGLESPIIILPDTEDRPASPAGSIAASPVDGTPLFMVRKEVSPGIITDARNAGRRREGEEEHRLLYVALTRAECWLIVCGEGRFREGCWYDRIESGLAGCDARERDFGGEAGEYAASGPGIRYCAGDWPASAVPRNGAVPAKPELPDWVKTRPVFPEASPAFLSPSGLGGGPPRKQDSGTGETSDADAAEFGNRVHLLLEHLPGVPSGRRPAAARSILKLHDPSIETAACGEAFEAAARLLEDPDLAFLFSGGSIAEAGITAASPTLDGRILHGFIDCLRVSSERVLVVDFKSNRVIPDRPEDIPESILRQMGAYREAVGAVYPDRRIETAVLWTRTAKLMMVPPGIGGEALKRAAAALS